MKILLLWLSQIYKEQEYDVCLIIYCIVLPLQAMFGEVQVLPEWTIYANVLNKLFDYLPHEPCIFFRDIYYSDVVFFGSQSIVDDIIDNLSCMIRVPRHSLHVVSW